MPIPFAAMADTYTACAGPIVAPAAAERSVYNLTFRRSPRAAWPGMAADDRLVFWGLGRYLREVLAGPPDLNCERVAAWAQAAGPLPFRRELWREAARLGFLPLRIVAPRDGEAFYPGEPVLQVENTLPGFGELAAHVEATLVGMVGCGTARATASRHLLALMEREVRLDHPSFDAPRAREVAAGLVHDFGMRASSTPLEAILFGQAHLLSFVGTDTAPAAYSAWEDSGGPARAECGRSILAHAHRVILGHDDEAAAVAALAEAVEDLPWPVASYLADTFGTRPFVERLAIPLARRYRERGRGRVVVRPDSGDPIANALMIRELAMGAGLVATTGEGRDAPTHLSILLGDAMDDRKAVAALDRLRAEGASATSWIAFGIGGWLRRQGDRDLLSAAYKLAAVGPGDRPVVKFSEVRAKCSVPGPTQLVRHPAGPDLPTVYLRHERGPDRSFEVTHPAYLDGSIPLAPGFAATRARSLRSWDDLPALAPDPLYSPAIERLRDPASNPARREVADA